MCRGARVCLPGETGPEPLCQCSAVPPSASPHSTVPKRPLTPQCRAVGPAPPGFLRALQWQCLPHRRSRHWTTPRRCLPAGSAVAWPYEPQGASRGCPGASTPCSGKRRRRMKPSHAGSLPFSACLSRATLLCSALLPQLAEVHLCLKCHLQRAAVSDLHVHPEPCRGEGWGEPLSAPQGTRAACVPAKTSLLQGLGWHLGNSCRGASPGVPATLQGSYLGH